MLLTILLALTIISSLVAIVAICELFALRKSKEALYKKYQEACDEKSALWIALYQTQKKVDEHEKSGCLK